MCEGTPFTVEREAVTAKKRRIHVHTAGFAEKEDGRVVKLCGSFRDVTAERALETELRKTKDFLEKLIDSAVDAIIAADTRGSIILFNPGAEKIFGWKAEEAIGGISVSGPTVRIDDAKLSSLGPAVRRTADELTRAIGGHRPEES